MHKLQYKVVLVVRKTRLDELVARFNSVDQAKFYIERLGADFSDYQAEHAQYKSQIREAENILGQFGRIQRLDRSFLPNYLFGPQDTVVALGQDGLVANVLKYLQGQPLIGVNPDPQRWDGVLLPFSVADLNHIVPETQKDQREMEEVTMAEASLNTGESLLAVNDLFIGPKSHTSARYEIEVGKQSETHSSSGVIVSTGLGSTGWLKSIIAGAMGISQAKSKRAPSTNMKTTSTSKTKTKPSGPPSMPWDSNYLVYSVREPWPSKNTQAGLTHGRVNPKCPLILKSLMPENGVIFSDGMEADFLTFNSGTVAHIRPANRKGLLVV